MKLYVCRMAVMMTVLAAVGFGQQVAFAQKGQGPVRAKKAVVSIPKNLAVLNLSEDQKTKILEVEEKYKEQIQALQIQLDDLRAKKAKEESDLLTPDQVAKLNEIAAAAKKARADNVAAAKKKVLEGNVPVKGQPAGNK